MMVLKILKLGFRDEGVALGTGPYSTLKEQSEDESSNPRFNAALGPLSERITSSMGRSVFARDNEMC